MFDRSADVYDLLYSFKDYEAEARDLVALIRERDPDARSLLDVACGTGKHLELLRASFPDVAGVDLDEGLLAIARERLPDVPLTMADMRTVDLGRTFDAVTCLFSSVGYLRDAGELASAIGRMAAHLAPGGVLVVDGWVRPDAWWPGTHVQALAETADGVAATRVARTWREGDRSVLDMRYLIATADDGFAQERERHELTLFTDAEYRRAFEAASLEPEVVPSPMQDRDRYVASRADGRCPGPPARLDCGEQMFESSVLGVDPGVARCGLAVLGRRDRTTDLRFVATVLTPTDADESVRLRTIADAARAAIAEHHPAAVAIERVAWSRNQVSALHVARATGAIMLVAAEAGLAVAEYAPNEVKQAVTGAGNADKGQVQMALTRIHGLRGVPAQADAADAVAVALTHLLAAHMRGVAARAGAR